MCATTREIGLGQRVRGARARLGLSREALAVNSGISWSAITQIESGRRRNVRPDTLAALSAALSVTVDYLVHGGASPVMFRHQSLLHQTDEEFMRTVGPFVADGIELSEPTLVVTTTAKADLVREHIRAAAGGVGFLDSARVFADPGALRHTFRTFVTDSLEHGAAWVRIVGEGPWGEKSAAEARRLHRGDSLLNLAFHGLPLTLICVFDERSVSPAIARQARATHPETISEEGPACNSAYVDPHAFVLDGRQGERPA